MTPGMTPGMTPSMTTSKHCSFELPDWVEPFIEDWAVPLTTVSQRMRLAIALSAENERQKTGGPFAAVVVNEETDELVSVGVNIVTTAGLSVAHAEIVALSLAQTAAKDWNLSNAGTLQLVSTCEPCAMCFGAVPWSGIKSLVCGKRMLRQRASMKATSRTNGSARCNAVASWCNVAC